MFEDIHICHVELAEAHLVVVEYAAAPSRALALDPRWACAACDGSCSSREVFGSTICQIESKVSDKLVWLNAANQRRFASVVALFCSWSVLRGCWQIEPDRMLLLTTLLLEAAAGLGIIMIEQLPNHPAMVRLALGCDTSLRWRSRAEQGSSRLQRLQTMSPPFGSSFSCSFNISTILPQETITDQSKIWYAVSFSCSATST